jgi:hypothetical protein
LFAFGINNTKYRLLNICCGKNIFNVIENLKVVLEKRIKKNLIIRNGYGCSIFYLALKKHTIE